MVGNNMYVVGEDRTDSGGRIDIVLWKNGELVQRIGSPGLSHSATGLYVLNNDVYIGGRERTVSSGVSITRIWKNGTSISFPDGFNESYVSELIVRD